MGSETNKLLGTFANSLSLLIKEHPQTNVVFETLRAKFRLFGDLVHKQSGGNVDVIQTGSSYDDLHFCRNISELEGKKQFFPPTDFDLMMICKEYPVEDYTHIKCAEINTDGKSMISEAIRTSKAAFLMVQSDHLGYVNLLVTDKGKEILQTKNQPHVVTESGLLPNNVFLPGKASDKNVEVIYRRVPMKNLISTGPALSDMEYEDRGYTYDYVFVFPCGQWPHVAERWNKRPRDAHWPSRSLINEIMTDGCGIVPVGFYSGANHYLEWRLSFNLSERKLSLALTRNQKVCYCLVKLMIKASLSEESILTSYMVKNMMFWFCEQQYGSEEWGDDQLGDRIYQLIEYIITALENHNIPHYFLPWNNLIGHKTIDEVQSTLCDVRRLKSELFRALFQICQKMKVFEVLKDNRGVFSSEAELQAMLTLYTGFAQVLFQLAMLNCEYPDLAIRCFQSIVSMNKAARNLIKVGSHLFTAESVLGLMKPFAIQFMQIGEVDKALALFKMMLSQCKDSVIETYPNAIVNIACLQAYKLDTLPQNPEKDTLRKNAYDHFEMALKYIKDSPTLHLAYGNFLKDSKTSILKAIEQYRLAISLDGSRQDDDALVQIALPGRKGGAAKPVYIPGKAAAFYSLLGILDDIDDVYEARRMARNLEEFVSTLELKARQTAIELCYHSYYKVGMVFKADLALQQSHNGHTI